MTEHGYQELPPDLAQALDDWIIKQPDPKPTRAEAIEIAVKDWLTGMGLMPVPPDDEGDLN
jgi:hypothetical protein